MKDFPSEIFHYIFINIPLKSKLECMLVCRQWEQNIRKRSLLHTLTICTKKSFLKLRKLLIMHPYLGSQVEYLTLYSPWESGFDPRIILKFFPNLRFIYLDIQSRGKNLVTSEEFVQELAVSKNRLEHIVDLHSSETTCFFLRLGVYLQLTTLELGSSHSMANSTIPFLKNAPNLHKLKISNIQITILDFELLHKQLPLLKTLNLDRAEIFIDIILAKTLPAKSLKTLSVNFQNTSTDSQIMYIDYAKNKYKNLSHISIKGSGTNDVSSKVVFPLIQSTGSQLKSLKLDQSPFDDVLCMELDKMGCQIQNLDIYTVNSTSIFQTLAMPNQSKYIQNLSLHNLTSFSVLVLEELPLLISLELRFGNQHSYQEKARQSEVNLGTFFKVCPLSLTSLLIDNGTLSDILSVTQPHPLLKLCLLRTKVPKCLNFLVSKYLTGLKTIILGHYSFIDEVLCLPDVHLSYFEIGFCHSREYVPVSVTSKKSNSQRFYKCKHSLKYNNGFNNYVSEYYPYSYSTIKQVNFGDINELHFLQLTFASVKTLVINSYLAC